MSPRKQSYNSNNDIQHLVEDQDIGMVQRSDGKLLEMPEHVKKFLMSDKQIQLTDSLGNMEEMIESMEQSNQNAENEIKKIHKALARLNEDRQGPDHPVIPGKKIQEFVSHWNDLLENNQYTSTQLKVFGTELAKSLREYEIELREIETGHTLLLKQQKKRYEGRIADIQNRTTIYIDQLEQALNYSKQKNVRHRERAEMQIAEMQSRLLNNVKTAKVMDEFILKCQGGKGFDNLSQAKIVIKQLTEMFIQTKESVDQLTEEKEELKTKLRKNFKMGNKIKEDLWKEGKMRRYYHQLVMKVCRDILIYHDDEVKRKKFDQIDENDTSITNQLQYSLILKNLNPEKELVNFINREQQYAEIIQKFNEYHEDFADQQMEAINEFMEEYFEDHFTSKKKKDKKFKLEKIEEFRDKIQETLNEQFQDVLDFVEETMDHQPQVQRANSRSGLHPSKADKSNHAAQLAAIQQKQKLQRQNSNVGSSSLRSSRRKSTKSFRGMMSDNYDDVQSIGNADEEMRSYKFSDVEFSEQNASPNVNMQKLNLNLSQKSVSYNEKFDDKDGNNEILEPDALSHSRRSSNLNSSASPMNFHKASLSPGGDSARNLNINSQMSESMKNQPMNMFAFRSKKLAARRRNKEQNEAKSMNQSSEKSLQSKMKSERKINLRRMKKSENESSKKSSSKKKSKSSNSSSDDEDSSSSESSSSEEGICKKCNQRLPGFTPEEEKQKKEQFEQFKQQEIERKEKEEEEKLKEEEDKKAEEEKEAAAEKMGEDGQGKDNNVIEGADQIDQKSLTQEEISQIMASAKKEKEQEMEKAKAEAEGNVSDLQVKLQDAFKTKYLGFEDLIQKQIEKTYITGRKFNLEDKQMEDLKQIFVDSQSCVVEEGDLQQLHKQDVGEFIKGFNQLITKIQKENEEPNIGTDAQSKSINFNELLIPQFGPDGQLKTLNIDQDLARVSYLKSDFDFNWLQKLIKHCAFVNRILNDGLNMDTTFNLKETVDNYVYRYEKEVQLDQNDFKRYLKGKDDDEEDECMNIEEYMEDLQACLMKHIINLRCRTNHDAKLQFQKDWKEYEIIDLLQIKLPDIFLDKKHQSQDNELMEDISAMEYIRGVFESVDFKIHCMKDPSNFNIEELIINPSDNWNKLNQMGNQGSIRNLTDVIKVQRDRAAQVEPVYCHRSIQTVKTIDHHKKVAQNLIILDKRLQDQMIHLIITFDEFIRRNQATISDSDDNTQKLKQALYHLDGIIKQSSDQAPVEKIKKEKPVVTKSYVDNSPQQRKVVVSQKQFQFSNIPNQDERNNRNTEQITSGTLTPVSGAKTQSPSPHYLNKTFQVDKKNFDYLDVSKQRTDYIEAQVQKQASNLLPNICDPSQQQLQTIIGSHHPDLKTQIKTRQIPSFNRNNFSLSLDIAAYQKQRQMKNVSVDQQKFDKMMQSKKLDEMSSDFRRRIDTDLGYYLKQPDSQIRRNKQLKMNDDLMFQNTYQTLQQFNSPMNIHPHNVHKTIIKKPSALSTSSKLPAGILRKIQKQHISKIDKKKSYITLDGMKRNPSLTKDTSNGRFHKQDSSDQFGNKKTQHGETTMGSNSKTYLNRSKKLAGDLSNSQSLNRGSFRPGQIKNDTSKLKLNQSQVRFQMRIKRSECLTPENQDINNKMKIPNMPRLDSEKRMIQDPSFQFLHMSPVSIKRNLNQTQAFFQSPNIANQSITVGRQFMTIHQLSPQQKQPLMFKSPNYTHQKMNQIGQQMHHQSSSDQELIEKTQTITDITVNNPFNFSQKQQSEYKKTKKNLILDLNKKAMHDKGTGSNTNFKVKNLMNKKNSENPTIYSDNSDDNVDQSPM